MLSEAIRDNTDFVAEHAPDRGVDWRNFDGLLVKPRAVPGISGDLTPTGDPSTMFLEQDASAVTCEDDSDGIRIFPVSVPVPPLERARREKFDVSSKLEVLQSWEGVVTEVDDLTREFSARLHDLTNSQGELREALFDLRDVSANDRDLLRAGAVFQWLIGYRRFNFGQMERVSSIVFRRLPAWHSEDLEAARREGEAIAAAFHAE